jgi:hypothetical protein
MKPFHAQMQFNKSWWQCLYRLSNQQISVMAGSCVVTTQSGSIQHAYTTLPMQVTYSGFWIGTTLSHDLRLLLSTQSLRRAAGCHLVCGHNTIFPRPTFYSLTHDVTCQETSTTREVGAPSVGPGCHGSTHQSTKCDTCYECTSAKSPLEAH